MSMLLELGSIFTPGLRHTIEEKRSESLRRKEAGKGRDDDQQIDLDAGVVYIRRPRSDADAPSSGSDDLNAEPGDIGEPATTMGERPDTVGAASPVR